MPKFKPKQGFFIKTILVINDEDDEKLLGKITSKDKHPIILDDGTTDQNRAKKIVKQIKLLAKIAVKNHNTNRLTKLVTDEFSFYTRATPLTLSEYKYIINSISRDLKRLPPNILLTISSMPVLWTDNRIRNAVLHIQSPNEQHLLPIIHHFSKENISSIDPYYNRVQYNKNSKRKNVKISAYEIGTDDYFGSKHNPNVVLKNTRAMCFDPLQYKSAIIVKGKNLPYIIDTVDICLDHHKRVAWKNAKKLLSRTQAISLPFYGIHTITSNVTDSNDNNLISTPAHADSSNKKVGNTPLKKSEKIQSHFGISCRVYVYHQKRAEILHSTHFKSVAQKARTLSTPIHAIVDNQNNTLLHQIFITDKHSKLDSTLLYKRFNSVIKQFNSDTINQQNKDGNTVFHLAITVSSVYILRTLMLKGARLDIRNNQNMTALEYITLNKDFTLIENLFLLIDSDTIPNQNYIEFLKFELQRTQLTNFNIKIILSALSKLNDLTALNVITISNLTIPEHLLMRTYLTKNHSLFDFLHQKFPKLFQFYIIDKIVSACPNKEMAKAWFCEEIIKKEFEKWRDADMNLIKSCLFYVKDLDQLSGINSLTIREQLIAQAYLSNHPQLFINLKLIRLKPINQEILKKIIDTLKDKNKARLWFQSAPWFRLANNTELPTLFSQKIKLYTNVTDENKLIEKLKIQ